MKQSLLILTPLALAAATALAQQAPAADTMLPVVRVKAKAVDDDKSSSGATRLELTLRETPQSITVIGQEQIRDFGLTDINKLLDLTPGVIVERVETDRTYFSARGFDVQNFQVDGLGLPFANGAQWGALDTAAFERVEVLRGATGLLAGTGNPSATVNFIRKRATSKAFAASAGLTLGSWNQHRVEADVAGGLNADGSLRGRLVIADEDKDSYLDRYGQHRSVVYGVMELDLSPSTQLTAGIHAQRSKARSPMWGALPLVDSTGQRVDYSRNTSTAADWAWWTNRDTELFAELTHDLGRGWQARASVSRRSRSTPSELLYVYGSPNPGNTPDSGLFAYPSAFAGKYVDTVADVFVSGPFTLAGRRHQLTFGLNAGRQTLDELSRYAGNIGAAVPPLQGWNGSFPKPAFGASTDYSDTTRRRESAYAAAQFNASDSLKLIAGLNATRVKSRGISYGVDQGYGHHAVKPYLGVAGSRHQPPAAGPAGRQQPGGRREGGLAAGPAERQRRAVPHPAAQRPRRGRAARRLQQLLHRHRRRQHRLRAGAERSPDAGLERRRRLDAAAPEGQRRRRREPLHPAPHTAPEHDVPGADAGQAGRRPALAERHQRRHRRRAAEALWRAGPERQLRHQPAMARRAVGQQRRQRQLPGQPEMGPGLLRRAAQRQRDGQLDVLNSSMSRRTSAKSKGLSSARTCGPKSLRSLPIG